jgi:hypothetical protein
MAKQPRPRSYVAPLRAVDSLSPPRRKGPPFPFVLEALDSAAPATRPLFSCFAVYVGPRIVFALRDRPTHFADNGVWIATTQEHHASLLREFPHMRSIGVLGKAVTGWQLLPADAPDFESAALRACELVLRQDPRIGKIPKAKRGKATR